MTIKKANVVFQNKYDDYDFTSDEFVFITDIPDLQEGQLVIVETKYGLQVGKFTGYVAVSEINPNKCIVATIDKAGVERIGYMKSEMLRVDSIMRKIEARMKEVARRNEIRELAKTDDELQALLNTLESIEG